MANLKKSMSLLCGAVIASCAMMAAAQRANQSGNRNSASAEHVCGTAKVIPLTGSEPPAKIFIDRGRWKSAREQAKSNPSMDPE